ncbi:MAG: dTDP-4-dehydrorhamnose 3,5-epimerase [Betaproteobacteria bacterium]|nr:dTDP-4-dehydrorhamnose 3,5-epimerase [Betaproteobacteria bacterium]HAB48021.1 dTDP-4-dehydrorhamnose 3,5-epimerase [Lautropia sp.]NBP39619.1 dTDP-4-dehydrorhamnose 3,5-epimerase [Betaproteobacteria bacterium]NBQ10118.1 dTDP-4-dehydrorhamnose 3,5-epimerase [Betaproteobacteria bacterium]NBQ79099.1 dTDP-4-dehydrorhamnose 3,5-epimerase [Betaproteobacteria bacterium]
MNAIKTGIDGLLIIEPTLFGDSRGFFQESWNEREFHAATGTEVHFVQDNHSRSARGVLRGLHYQQKRPQAKLVRVVSGCVWDVAVDLRPGSASFGKSFACELSADNHRQLWIPEGFAHGFLVLSESADFLYKTSEYWTPAYERSLLWSDPELGIDWPLESIGQPTLAAKDAAARSLSALQHQGELPEMH